MEKDKIMNINVFDGDDGIKYIRYSDMEKMLKRIKEVHDKIEDDLKAEIKRLNNIINEFERYINEEYIYDELGMKIFDASKLQDKLQELKGVDKK